MISLLVKFFLGFKSQLIRVLLIVGVIYGLYYYYESSQEAINTATEKAVVLEGVNQKLVDEVKDIKEQSPIDNKTVSEHQKDLGDLNVFQIVADEKVQYEVSLMLQGVPAEKRDSKEVVDSVSRAVISGMWNSYKGSVRGGATPSTTK